jgi:hypothetical protein
MYCDQLTGCASISNSGTATAWAHFSLSNTNPPGAEPSDQRAAGTTSGSRAAAVCAWIGEPSGTPASGPASPAAHPAGLHETARDGRNRGRRRFPASFPAIPVWSPGFPAARRAWPQIPAALTGPARLGEFLRPPDVGVGLDGRQARRLMRAGAALSAQVLRAIQCSANQPACPASHTAGACPVAAGAGAAWVTAASWAASRRSVWLRASMSASDSPSRPAWRMAGESISGAVDSCTRRPVFKNSIIGGAAGMFGRKARA